MSIYLLDRRPAGAARGKNGACSGSEPRGSGTCRALRSGVLGVLLLWGSLVGAGAADLDTIGVSLLRQVDPTLTGTGVVAAQPEATTTGSDFEVSPLAVGQPVSLFTWLSSSGSATSFTNTVGTESAHADLVGANFYGSGAGAAPGINHVDNYEAGYFINTFIAGAVQMSIPARVVNQSFLISASQQTLADTDYDNYAAGFGTIFLSGVGNGGTVGPPGTCYNGMGVGVYGISSAVGPTPDGRCKPDLVAPDEANSPSGANSYAIPYASGGAAMLVQAATRGDGGSNDVASASNLRTIKALLLNGAVKPSDWTNSSTRPLDLHYGAGVLNVFNSWNQMKGGKHPYIETTTNAIGAPHPAGTNTNNVAVLVGWDYNTITTHISGLTTNEQVNHYYFKLPGTNNYTLTATLAWNRQRSQSKINDLNLFLYNAANSNQVAASVSAVDNVEHIFLISLPPGRYDLQVQKNPEGEVSLSENYALAFEFFNLKLNIARSNSDVVLSWPIAPDGFHLMSTPALNPPSTWSAVSAPVTVSNGQNVVSVPSSSGDQFFRLQRP